MYGAIDGGNKSGETEQGHGWWETPAFSAGTSTEQSRDFCMYLSLLLVLIIFIQFQVTHDIKHDQEWKYFLVEFFKSWLLQEKKNLKKNSIFPRTEESPVTEKDRSQSGRIKVCVCPVPVSHDGALQKDSEGTHHQSTRKETSPAARGTLVGFFYVLVCEKKELFIQNAASGNRKTRRRMATQWPPRIAGSSSASVPGLQEVSHADSKCPALIRRGDGADLKCCKSHENAINHAQSSGRCFLPEHQEDTRQKLRLGRSALPLLGLEAEDFYSPKRVDERGWSTLSRNPGLAGSPDLFWVTESLCLGFVGQMGTLRSLSPSCWLCIKVALTRARC